MENYFCSKRIWESTLAGYGPFVLQRVSSEHLYSVKLLFHLLIACLWLGKCCKNELLGQQTCSNQICMLVRAKPGEVRPLCVYHNILPPVAPLLFFFSCCCFGAVCVMSESPHSTISSSSSSNSSAASGQTLGQCLTYFIRLSGRRDRSNTTRLDRREKEEDRGAELGRRASANPPCSICLPHPSPVHILRRAETASHVETNVKINHRNLSCSALACSPLVTFPFHSSSQAISSPNRKDPFCTLSYPLLHFMRNELQPQCLPLATQHGSMGRPTVSVRESASC